MATVTKPLDAVQTMLVNVVTHAQQQTIQEANQLAALRLQPLYTALGIPDGTQVTFGNGTSSWDAPAVVPVVAPDAPVDSPA